mmetsp:Transcript_64060/g.166456  ORF Transcript_64060/g.166456 Transcript_64060/m.166456 type:complete len:210 (-) Transcript_64060:287-916(-)
MHELAAVHQCIELLERLLVLKSHPEVAPVVDGGRPQALEVSDAREDERVEPIQEVHHLIPLQGHRHAALHAFAPLQSSDVYPRFGNVRLLAGDTADLFHHLVEDFGVRCLLCLQPRLDANLREAGFVPGLGAPWNELPLQTPQPLCPLLHAVQLHIVRLLPWLQLRLPIVDQHLLSVQHGPAARLAIAAGCACDARGGPRLCWTATHHS